MAVFNYELAVRLGLQESLGQVGEFGVQVNRAFGLADTIVYVPLMVLSLVGLTLKKRWALLTTAAAVGVSAYWSATVGLMLVFLPGVGGYTLVAGPEYWLYIGAYFLLGALGLVYLAFRGETLLQ